MAFLQIENLSFSYPECSENAISDICFSVNEGEIILIIGGSGSGKTTLLRSLKPMIAPHGKKKGKILFKGEDIDLLSAENSAFDIGYVGQHPDEQIITDKVWHELAFSVENQGFESAVIRRRVAEMASYFGIEDWFYRDTDTLSGGQKQLLNLASVMVSSPKLLLLDEPTSRLDPICASDFTATVQKLNRELGLTVILAEHRFEELFHIADKIVYLENGRVSFCGTPQKACEYISQTAFSACLPCAARIFSALKPNSALPLTVREGRNMLKAEYQVLKGMAVEEKNNDFSENVIEAQNVCFRYERKDKDILSDFNLCVKKGEVISLLGGNGAGKTTALKVLAALEKPYKGKIKINGKKISSYHDNSLYRGVLGLLPQNPLTAFSKDTVFDDLAEVLLFNGMTKENIEKYIKIQTEKFAVTHLLARNPYDLSGGEQQRCAIIKLLLNNPQIILMDEPTKGMDAVLKQQFCEIIAELKKEGRTVVIVTHDLEFAARVSDRCGLLFSGEIVSIQSSNSFFSGNKFYTTSAHRISSGIFSNAVLCEEVVELCLKGESL